MQNHGLSDLLNEKKRKLIKTIQNLVSILVICVWICENFFVM